MPLFWLALAVAIGAVIASSIYLTMKGREAFRGAKRLGGAVTGELDRIERASSEIEQHLTRAADSGSKLDAELAQLRRSRARLNVLTSALADARASVDRLTAVYPRK